MSLLFRRWTSSFQKAARLRNGVLGPRETTSRTIRSIRGMQRPVSTEPIRPVRPGNPNAWDGGYAAVNEIIQTSAAGVHVKGSRLFNDLVEHGNFPVEQNIVRIVRVELWADDRVNGIKVTYLLKNGTTVAQLRGRDTGLPAILNLAGHQLITGVSGRRDTDGNIGSLSFIVFDINSSRLTLCGPFGNPPNPGKPFGTFGSIFAFSGSDENHFGLCSLSILKAHSPGTVML